jgi:hypothetical protein
VSERIASFDPPHTLCSRLPIDEDDVALVFEDSHLSRSAVPPHAAPAHPTLLRWDQAKPLALFAVASRVCTSLHIRRSHVVGGSHLQLSLGR